MRKLVIGLVCVASILLVCLIIFVLICMCKSGIQENMEVKKRIQFVDFWKDFWKHNNNYFTDLLTRYGYKFKIVDENPDIIIFSVFGSYCNNYNKKDKNVKKIFFTGENWNILDVDLNLTFENTSESNNIRFPLFLTYPQTELGLEDAYMGPSKGLENKYQLEKKKIDGFCCFVYSHEVEHRNNFCLELSKYKKVDCGGNCLNNIGEKLEKGSNYKIDFQKKYKFCIAYENSARPGYTTEKILEAYMSNCIPIYYGSITIEDDFNPETFINSHNFDNNDDLIEYIKKVDTDEDLYNSYLNKPFLSKKWLDIVNDPNELFYKDVAKKIMS